MARNLVERTWRARADVEQVDLKGIYLQWLEGKSLRYLAAQIRQKHGIRLTHTSLYSWLNKEFGDDATDPVAMSLQRSLLEDYEGTPHEKTVREFVLQNLSLRSDVQHRSKHSIKQLTLYQCAKTDEILEYMTPQDDYQGNSSDDWAGLD